MKTSALSRSTALSLLCAAGLALGGIASAHAAKPVSDLARLDGSIGYVGKADPFTDGARVGKPDPFTDGANVVDKRDPFTDGAHVGDKRDAFTDGA